MSRPVVALIGRPNVGKSTVFNRLCGQRRAIVQDEPGVTRDRHYAEITLNERPVLLVDTGGFEPKTNDDMLLAMRRQTELAIEEADVVVLVVDGKNGMRPEDKEISRRLRKGGKKILVCVNKIDTEKTAANVYEFTRLGIDALVSTSAEHNLGTDDLIDLIVAALPPVVEAPPAAEVKARVCVLGRPNAGKSSLINRLLGVERHLATPIAGTTRDSIDSLLERDGDTYCFIDTAGIRRKARVAEQLEEYMVVAAIRSIEHADVVVIVLDATEMASDQDAKIAALAHDRGKAIVLAVNKWDLQHPNLNPKNLRQELDDRMPFLSYARLVYMSAKTGQGIDQLFIEIEGALEERQRRVPTGELNRLVAQLLEQHAPQYQKGKRGKIYFATQVSVAPPTFVMAVNDPDRFTKDYSRYLQNALRKEYGFSGTPLVIKYRSRQDKRGPKDWPEDGGA